MGGGRCRGAGTSRGVRLTTVPDYLMYAGGFEQAVQRGYSREEALSGQINGAEDRSTLGRA